MRSLTTAGDYHIFGRCNDIDGVQVQAARKRDDMKGERLFSLHHFPFMNPTSEQELRGLAERTRNFDDPIMTLPREIVRTEDGVFVVTDFVAGESLEHIVKSHRGAIPKLLAIAIVRDLARAVERARDATGRAMVGDVTSSHAIINYENGELKLTSIGIPLIRGRAIVPATKCLAGILYELLAGKRFEGDAPPRAGAELDRIVMNGIVYPSEETQVFAEDLQSYLSSRTTGIDRGAELGKLMRQHFSHKSTAMRALVQRWRAQSVPPHRSRSITPIPLTRPSSSRPVRERSLEAALAEPISRVEEIVILDPEELLPTDDLSNSSLREKRRAGWPKIRLAFFMFLLSLACATVALVLMNGEGDSLLAGWRSIAAMIEILVRSFG